MIKTQALEGAEDIFNQWQKDVYSLFYYLNSRYFLCVDDALNVPKLDHWIVPGEEFEIKRFSLLVNEFKDNLLSCGHSNIEFAYLARIDRLMGLVGEPLPTHLDITSTTVNCRGERIELIPSDKRLQKLLKRVSMEFAITKACIVDVASTSFVMAQYPDKFKHLQSYSLSVGHVGIDSESKQPTKDMPTKDQVLLLHELGIFDLPAIQNLTIENKGVLFARLLNRNEKNVTECIRNCDPKGHKQSEDNPYIYENKVASIRQLLTKIGFLKKM